MIEGVVITPLRQIEDRRGKVMHMLRRDSPIFTEFGEIYFSTANPGAVKGWNRHRRMCLNYAVPHGRILLVLFDERASSPTTGVVQELTVGDGNYSLITIPPMIWTSFKGVSNVPALVANCATLPHDPEEAEQRALDDPSMPYRWTTEGQ
jgi:dTDP-4-dehydrorhamnose 3,5-epimerase